MVISNETKTKAEVNGITDIASEVRCSHCGRFLGYASIKDGLVIIKCKNCKNWSIIAEGPTFESLTTKAIYDMVVPAKGQ